MRAVLLRILVAMLVLGVCAAIQSTRTLNDIASLEQGNHTFEMTDDISLILEMKEETFRLGAVSEKMGLNAFRLKIVLSDGARSVRSGSVAIMAKSVTILEEFPRSLIPNDDVEVTFTEEDIPRSRYEFKVEEPLKIKPNMYDLRPANSTYGVYFMLNVTESSISWFVKRRPPIPGFLAMIFDDNGVELSRAPVNNVPSDGIGFTNVVDKNKKYENVDLKSLLLVVEFAEFPRREKLSATFSFDDAADDIDSEKGFSVPFGSDASLGVKIKKQKDASVGELNVLLEQVVPIQNLLVRIKDGDKVIFAEAESNIPFTTPEDEGATPFGWIKAVKVTNVESELTVEAYFDKQNLPKGTTGAAAKVYDVFRFIQDHNGYVGNIAPRHHKSNKLMSLVTTRHVRKNDIMFSIPYKLLLQHQVCEKVPAIKSLLNDDDWLEFVEEKPAILNNVVSMALCTVMKPNSPFDGTNWRVVFDSFFPSTPDLPMFWEATEIEALLGWSGVKTEINLQQETWREEHTLVDGVLGGNLSRRISYSEYASARGHMLSKLINVSGSLVLPPLHAFLHHDEEPSVAGLLDHEHRRYVVYALRDIADREILTVNKGAKDKFKGEYFVHFGNVPHDAVDSVAIAQLGIPLTTEKKSRHLALIKLMTKAEELKTDASEQAATSALLEILRKQLGDLPASIRKTASADPRRVAYAERILKAERHVLETQISFIEEDLSEL